MYQYYTIILHNFQVFNEKTSLELYSYTLIFNKPIPKATKATAKTSFIFDFFSLFFITNAINIVNTIDTGLVTELNTTELVDK